MNKLRPYSWTRQTVIESGEIPIKQGTFGILVTNIGAVGASQIRVEGYPINAPLVAGSNGESWSVGGPEGTEINKQTLEILFTTGAGQCFVQMMYYTDLYK